METENAIEPVRNDNGWDFHPFWEEATRQIKKDLPDQEFGMWFHNISYHGSNSAGLLLSVPSAFYRDQIRQRYHKLILEKLHDISGRVISVDYIVKKAEKLPASKTEQTPDSASRKPVPTKPVQHAALKKEYNFDSFVIGENNNFAANAAIAIAKNPGTAYNPCLIYGGVGLGKTHLIQAIGNFVHTANEKLKIIYVSAENFINEFTGHIQTNSMQKFKNKYRNSDLLLIDDIHFFQGKPGTQEELFHIFNSLYETNKQLVFTCDRPVSELTNLTDRLRSRFERGLTVDLQPPSFETRLAIIKKKSQERNALVPDEVAYFIANRVTTNVRDLEAALTKVIAYADIVKKEINLEIVQNLLKDVASPQSKKPVTIDIIKRTVAEYFSMSPGELSNKKRNKSVAFPRQIAMYLSREMTEFSTTEVGTEFGGRDHTTVMHACQKVENLLKTDPNLEDLINRLMRKVNEIITSQ